MANIILGIDEVGRGPWAGPLVVGAVVLGADFARSYPEIWDKLADSKQLTPKRREELAPLIRQHTAASATGWVTSQELDRYGLAATLKLATRRAVKQILATKTKFDEIIIDGTSNFLINTPLADRVTLLKKADSLIKEVSAASIIAKVERDQYMTDLAKTYPEYGFDRHAGYGTKVHQEALQKYGPCPEHRQSFRPIAELNQNTKPTPQPQTTNKIVKTSTAKGQKAELAVAAYLENLGHTIIAHNYKHKTYEIDLISTLNNQIFFTEVKYSQNTRIEGTTLVRITPAKQRQMRYAAQAFVHSHPSYSQLQPLLAVAEVIGNDYLVKNWLLLC